MAVRSKCLVSPATIPAATTVAYTVPAGETALVKWVSMVNTGGTARSTSLYVNAGSGAVRTWFGDVPATGQVQLDVWWALAPGWTLSWSSVGGVVTAAVFGSELEGVAD